MTTATLIDPDTCASAWRDCQLTATQIATLERLEREGTAPRTLTQVAAALQDANESMR